MNMLKKMIWLFLMLDMELCLPYRLKTDSEKKVKTESEEKVKTKSEKVKQVILLTTIFKVVSRMYITFGG